MLTIKIWNKLCDILNGTKYFLYITIVIYDYRKLTFIITLFTINKVIMSSSHNNEKTNDKPSKKKLAELEANLPTCLSVAEILELKKWRLHLERLPPDKIQYEAYKIIMDKRAEEYTATDSSCILL